MSDLILETPGLRRFARAVVGDLENGRNVVLQTPSRRGPWLTDALQLEARRLSSEGLISLGLRDSAPDPHDFVAAHFGKELVSHGEVSFPRLLQKMASRGMFILVDGVTDSLVTPWLCFLKKYADVCRAVNGLDRIVFCVIVQGAVSAGVYEDVTITLRSWTDAIDKSDTLCLATQVIRENRGATLHKKLAAAIVAELSGDDLDLALYLARLSLPELLDPAAVLAAYGRERMGLAVGIKAPSGQDGTLTSVEGQKFVHSAYLAMKGEPDQIRRRIWNAQIATLFPFLEQERLRLVRRVSDSFRRACGATPPEDLELGDLCRDADRAFSDPRDRQLLRVLRDIRNCLAHNEIVLFGLIEACCPSRGYSCTQNG